MSNGSATDSFLLVPMNVEALVVGAPAGQWTYLRHDFTHLYEATILGSQLAPKPLEAKKQGLAPGVHLHWALPDALTHGRQERLPGAPEATGALEFPLIPNRWMVQRISRKPQTNEIAVRAWVVESDFLYGTDGLKKEDAVTFPRIDTEALFDYVGKAFDYSSWSEKQPGYRLPLTALGYGDPAFAAFYPACRSLLGFHDPLKDVDGKATFTYLVAGWYSDPAQDVLRRHSLGQLKWACATKSDSVPNRTLCHGTIYNIQWTGRSTGYELAIEGVDHEKFRFAVGNTTTEALAALLADQLQKPGVEPLLEAFSEDQLAQNGDLAELEFSLHAQRYGSLSGGQEYAIQKKSAIPDQNATATDITLPEGLERALVALNALEMELERRQRHYEDYRWEIYAVWHKWAMEYTKPSRKEPAHLTTKLNDLKDRLAGEARQIDTLKGQRDAAERAIRNTVVQQFADLEVVTSPTAPFWQASDPVVLISGPGIMPSRRHGHDGRYSHKNELHCRTTGQELGSLVVDIPNGQPGVPVSVAEVFQIKGTPFAGGGAVPKGITDALLSEALLLDPGNADAIAEQAYENAGLKTRSDKDQLIGHIKRLQRPPASPPKPDVLVTSSSYGGVLPSPIALRDWAGNPWLPLFLAWRVTWYPSYTSLGTSVGRWQLDADAVDFRWTGAPPDLASSRSYEGYTILTGQAVEQFKERLRKYNLDHPNQDLSPVTTYLDQIPVLGQALAGLGDAFLMRNPCLQITPINPAIFAGKQVSERDPIIGVVKGANFASPVPENPFLPIRAGHLRVEALSVIDAFGQTLQLRNFDKPIRAASLRADESKTEALLRFAPRFCKPLRLRFDWIPAVSPAGTLPVDNPVCGWVIPNHLDKSLTFYDGRGTPLGALQKILRTKASGGSGGTLRKDVKAFFWVPMPGTKHRPEDIFNPHLRHFVEFVRRMDADTGTAYWNLLDEALSKTDPGEPEDDPLLSILLGRPLALVRAELGLELAGLPASDQSASLTGDFDHKGLKKIKFPVHLGEAQQDSDGLVGFFAHDSKSDILGPFYPAAGATGTAYSGAIEYGKTLMVDCESRLTATLLMDPRAKVHAITGILPKKAVTLPPRVSSTAKSAKEAFFQVAPLVSPGGAVTMPKPSDDFGKWSWAYRPKVTMWKEVESLSAAADQAGFATEPQKLSEGWLKLRMNPVAILNLWVKEGTIVVQPKTNITLGWTLVGGDRVSLSASEDGKDAQRLNEWNASPLPQEWRVQVQAATTYILVLQDKDGNRSEKRLTVTVKGG